MPAPRTGSITWVDLTVSDAATVGNFYQEVVGWTAQPVDMGTHSDFSMLPPGSAQPVAGICHARGTNADLPPQWLIYITVADLDASLLRCKESSGQVLSSIKTAGEGRFAVIRDPAGALCALYQPAG